VTAARSRIVCPPRPCSAKVKGGEKVTLRAIRNSAYDFRFTKWLGGPCDGQTVPTCTVTGKARRNTQVIAVFVG
jgi:hypothetical protein